MARLNGIILISIFAAAVSGCAGRAPGTVLDLAPARSPEQPVVRETPTPQAPTPQTRSPAPEQPPIAAEGLTEEVAEPEVQFESLVRRITSAYKDFQFHLVTQLTERLLETKGATRRQRIHALVLAGASSFLQRSYERAQWYFGEALSLNAELQLNDRLFPQAILNFFKEVQAAEPGFPYPGASGVYRNRKDSHLW